MIARCRARFFGSARQPRACLSPWATNWIDPDPRGDTSTATAAVILRGPALYLSGNALSSFALTGRTPRSRLVGIVPLAALVPFAVVEPLAASNPQPVATPVIGYDSFDQYVFDGIAAIAGALTLLCVSHFTFHRNGALPQATADVHGNVYVTWEQLDADLDNGDTYHPDGQSQVVVSRSSNGGGNWAPPQKGDAQAAGHQFWPNLEYDMSTDRIVLTYYDSREDPSYSP